jgi:hypothetical protein
MESLVAQATHSATIPRKTQIMNPALFGLVIIASQFLVALALLFIAGSLIRIDLNRAEAADSRFAKIPSRFIRDLRALKDALVEFFTRSNESCRILSVLVAHRKPLRLSAIAQKVQLETDRRREPYILPMSIAWAVLWILQVSGLVRMSLHGFLVTEVGREVYRRIEGNSTISAEGQATYYRARTVRDQCGPDRGLSIGHVTVVPQNRKFRSSNPSERCIAAAAPNV